MAGSYTSAPLEGAEPGDGAVCVQRGKTMTKRYEILLRFGWAAAGAALLLTACFPSHVFSPKGKIAEIEINIEAVRSNKGMVLIALYQTKPNFMKEDKAIVRYAVKANKTGVVAVIRGELATGEYAIAVYHDENGNSKLDLRKSGIPKEGVGFSNNLKSEKNTPDWNTAAFSVSEGDNAVKIKMNYLDSVAQKEN